MTATADTGRTVGRTRAIALSYRVLIRQLVNRARLAFLALLGIAFVLLGWAVGAADLDPDPDYPGVDPYLLAAVRSVSGFGLAVIVPVIALVFASAALGDTRDDGTLVYLWLRPMDRAPVVLGAFGAALTVVAPLTVVPVVVGATLADGSSEVIIGAALSAAVGAVAYTGLFVLAGLVLKRAILWGLLYILIWEGAIAALSNIAARVAIRGYTRSILTDITEVELELGDLSAAAGTIVPLVLTALFLALATIRLNRLDVA